MSPIELPTRTAKDPREQSHDYTTSTKSNPIETLLPAHAVPQLFPPKASGTIESRGRKQGVSRYRIASMAARFRIA